MMRVRGSASAMSSASSLRFSDWRSMRLPAKPTKLLGSRSGARKRGKVMIRGRALWRERRSYLRDELVQILAPIGLARAGAPDRAGPAGIALVAGDDVDVKLRHDIAQR